MNRSPDALGPEARPAGPAGFAQKPSRADLAVMVLAFSLALVIRLAYLFEVRDLTFFVSPVIDAQTYLEQARSVAAGRLLEEEAFWQPPLYPYLLGLLTLIFGERHFLLHGLHCLLGAFNCSLIVLVGLRSVGRGPAWLAGLAAAFYGPFIFFEGEYLTPVLSVFLNLLLLNFLLAGIRSGAKSAFAGSGLCFGLSAIVRPDILVFLPLALVFIWRRLGGGLSGKPLLARLALLLFFCSLPIAPVTLHNAVVSRELVLISSNGGNNFYLGNNREWRRTTAIRPDFEWADLTAEPFRHGALSPGQRSAWFRDQALDDIKADPGAWLWSLTVKTGQFFHGHEWPRNVDPHLYRQHSRVLAALLWERGVAFPFGLASPLMVLGVGLAVFVRRAPATSLLALYVASYVAAVSFFFVASRYRLPAVPVMLLFAGSAVFWLAGAVRSRRFVPAAAGSGLLAAGLVFANFGLADAPRSAPWEEPLLLGHSYFARGLTGEAIREYERARELSPERPDPYFSLGLAHFRRGETDQARRYFFQTLERSRPKSMAAAWSYETLGDLSLSEHDPDRAAEYYQKSLAAYPFMFGARMGLARIYQTQGRLDLARAELEILIGQRPRRPEPYLALSRLEARAGNPDLSRELFEQGRRLGGH